jgi:hypothetical protein
VQETGQYGHAYVLRQEAAAPSTTMEARSDTGHTCEPHSVWRFYERVPAAAAYENPAPNSDAPVSNTLRYAHIGDEHPYPHTYAHAGDEHTSSTGDTGDGVWAENLLFELYGRSEPFETFTEMCNYHQSHAQSPFTQGVVCSRATCTGGRNTLASGLWKGCSSDDTELMLFQREGPHSKRVGTPVRGGVEGKEVKEILAKLFQIELPE